MKRLKKNFEKKKDQYEMLKQRAEKQVVEWKWTKGPVYDLEAFYPERNEEKKGILLEKKPLSPEDCLQYGFDKEGRVCVIRLLSDTSFDVFCEEFFFYEEDNAESYFFNEEKSKKLIQMKEYLYENSTLMKVRNVKEGYNKLAWSEETYCYEKNVLVAIEIKSSLSSESRNVPFEKTMEWFVYDEEKHLVSIERTWFEDGANPKYKHFIYHKMDPAVTFEEVFNYLKQTVAEGIQKVILEENFEEPIYVMVLDYGFGSSGFVPRVVYVGVESDRQYILENYESYEKGIIWYGGEFETILVADIREDAMWEKYEAMFDTYIREQEAFEKVALLAEEICRELQQVNWKEFVSISDDFILFPMDADEENYEEVFEKFVPRELIKQFRKKKWL